MTAVRSVPVENRLGTSTTPFWPGGGKQLNVEFGADSDGTCRVRGIDPDNNDEVVFNGILRTAQQDRFIEAVRAGQQGMLVSNENQALRLAITAHRRAGLVPAWYLVPLASVASDATDGSCDRGWTANPRDSRVDMPESLVSITDPVEPPDVFAVVIPGSGPPPP